MKKGVFLVSMLMMVSTLGAMEGNQHNSSVTDYNPYNDKSIAFVERGIKFYVFLDGQFDFNTAPTADVDYIYRSRRGGNRYNLHRGIRIERDYQGRIRRVGNVFISYSFDNKIKRIGSVFIKYRHGRMKKVGNLRIYYYPYDVEFVGSVKGYNSYYNPYYSYGWSSFNTWNSWNNYEAWEYGYYDPFFDDDNFFDNYESFDEDDDYYYYRSRRNGVRKGTKGKSQNKTRIIKRKKATKSKRHETRKKVAIPKRILKTKRSISGYKKKS